MSRIYENTPLKNLPVVTKQWKGEWNPEQWQTGPGVLIEGIIITVSRITIAFPSAKTKYFIFQIKASEAWKRKFDPHGKELEPNLIKAQKVTTGYLNLYTEKANTESDAIRLEEVPSFVKNTELENICPPSSGCLPFWALESTLKNIDTEVLVGQQVRLKTCGNSPFISTIAKIDASSATTSQFTGSQTVGDKWTNKIMNVKQQIEEVTEPGSGVDDDEWDN